MINCPTLARYHVQSRAAGSAMALIVLPKKTWSCAPDKLGPIAVEPYGSVTTLGRACRQPKDKADFYTLLDQWLLKDVAPSPENQHFVMATLIRGGVFGDAGKD